MTYSFHKIDNTVTKFPAVRGIALISLVNPWLSVYILERLGQHVHCVYDHGGFSSKVPIRQHHIVPALVQFLADFLHLRIFRIYYPYLK